MGTSVLLAKLIGLPILVVGLGFLFDKEHFKKVMKEVVTSPGLYYMSGMMALIVGLVIVLYHNVWEGTWEIAITVIGWFALVKGVVRLLLPRWGMGIVQS